MKKREILCSMGLGKDRVYSTSDGNLLIRFSDCQNLVGHRTKARFWSINDHLLLD